MHRKPPVNVNLVPLQFHAPSPNRQSWSLRYVIITYVSRSEWKGQLIGVQCCCWW